VLLEHGKASVQTSMMSWMQNDGGYDTETLGSLFAWVVGHGSPTLPDHSSEAWWRFSVIPKASCFVSDIQLKGQIRPNHVLHL